MEAPDGSYVFTPHFTIFKWQCEAYVMYLYWILYLYNVLNNFPIGWEVRSRGCYKKVLNLLHTTKPERTPWAASTMPRCTSAIMRVWSKILLNALHGYPPAHAYIHMIHALTFSPRALASPERPERHGGKKMKKQAPCFGTTGNAGHGRCKIIFKPAKRKILIILCIFGFCLGFLPAPRHVKQWVKGK